MSKEIYKYYTTAGWSIVPSVSFQWGAGYPKQIVGHKSAGTTT